MRFYVMVATALISFVIPALADDAVDKRAAESLVKAFIGICVQSVPDLDRIAKSAEAMHWKEITGLEGTMMAPPSPTAKFKTWLITGVAEVPFAMSISDDDGQKASVCTVINPYAPSEPVETALKDFLKLPAPLETKTEGGQRYYYWETSFNENKIFVSAVDASPMKESGINLAASVISKY